MTREEVLKELANIFSEVLDYDEEVKEELTKEDVDEWDSMTHVMLLSKVQKKFDVKFDMNNLIKYDSVKKIVDGVLEGK